MDVLVVSGIYSIQVTVLVIIACIRFFTYKSVSKHNRRMILRPSHVMKLSLHLLIWLDLFV